MTSPTKSSECILVVDDDPSFLELLRQVLTEAGHVVTTATHAESALAIYRTNPVPLVITDIWLPGMNGLQLMEAIKGLRQDAEIVVATGHASMDSAIDALRRGAYDYLTKPLEDISLITSVVDRALEKIQLQRHNRELVDQLRHNNNTLERANHVLKDLALHDGLTGLFNHRHFQESLTLEVMRAGRYQHDFSLIFLDVDFFKQYNDTHGHPAGDRLLCMLATLLKAGTPCLGFAARYGGEEFVLLLPETGKVEAATLAERLRLQIANNVFPSHETIPETRVTVSIGVATFPKDGEHAQILLEHVDQALYQAKHQGRNQVVAYAPS